MAKSSRPLLSGLDVIPKGEDCYEPTKHCSRPLLSGLDVIHEEI